MTNKTSGLSFHEEEKGSAETTPAEPNQTQYRSNQTHKRRAQRNEALALWDSVPRSTTSPSRGREGSNTREDLDEPDNEADCHFCAPGSILEQE